MDNQLFLSIVIPVYNLERYIVPCLESIFANRDIDKSLFEVIVVNDESVDSTVVLVEDYIKNFPLHKIRLISQTNQGVSVARNHGLLEARGEFVWFVDGDDAISHDAVSRLYAIQRENIDLIRIGDCVDNLLFEDNGIFGVYKSSANPKEGRQLPAHELLGNEFQHGHTTYIWRRQFLIDKSLRYPVGISQNEDFCFLVPALLSANVAYVNLSFRFYLYRERLHSASKGYYDRQRLEKLVQNKSKVLDKLLEIKADDIQKNNYLQNYLNYYVYTIVCDCFFRHFPLSFISQCLKELENKGLYPMNFSVYKVSRFRIWLFSNKYLFMMACICYKRISKLFIHKV